MPTDTRLFREKGLLQAEQKIGRLADRLQDFQPMLEDAGKAYFGHIAWIFATEGGNSKWADLSHKRYLARGKNAHPILAWTGQLRNAATLGYSVSGDGAESSIRYGPYSAEWTIEGDKVRNQFGFQSDDGYGNVPARPFWPWGDQEHDIVFNAFEQSFDHWSDSWLAR